MYGHWHLLKITREPPARRAKHAGPRIHSKARRLASCGCKASAVDAARSCRLAKPAGATQSSGSKPCAESQHRHQGGALALPAGHSHPCTPLSPLVASTTSSRVIWVVFTAEVIVLCQEEHAVALLQRRLRREREAAAIQGQRHVLSSLTATLRKSCARHTLRSRIGTQGQFQNPCSASSRLSS